ncbi:hypothetical protein HRbin35_00202 [bacterium HR35]|nr:hypothetical protein HRbin35_00202 [bacterium HR35]
MDDKNNNPNTTNTSGSEQKPETYPVEEDVREVMDDMQRALN